MIERRGLRPLTSGALVFLLFLALGTAYTLPLIRHVSSGLPYTHAPQPGAEIVERAQGDYLQFYYHLWLFRDALAGRTPLFSNPYEFAWDGPRPRFWTYFLPLSLVYLAFTPLGDYVAYNLVVIASFGLAGLAMFLLARELGGGDRAALVAATVFALAPYRYAALAGGHPAGAAFFLVPLTLLGVERSLRRGSRSGSALAGAGLLSLAFVEPHFLYFLLLLLPPLILVRTLLNLPEPPRGGWPGLRDRLAAAGRRLVPLWPLGLLALTAAGVMLYVKATTLDVSVARSGRTLREIGLFSPDPRDWLIRFHDATGRSIYPGVAALALAGIGLAGGGLARGTAAARGRWWLALLFLLAEILSLGPRAPVPLYGWLHELVPFFGFVRQTGKFQVLALTALALLAASGAQRLLRAAGPRPWATAGVAAALVAAVAGDYWPARPIGVSLLPTHNRVYQLLRDADPGRVVYLPIWPGDSSWSSLYQFAATLTRRPMVNGYSPMGSRRYVDEVYWPLDHLNRGELTLGEHERLRALGVRLVVLDRGAFPSKVSPFPSGFTLDRLRASPYVDLVGSEEPLWLFALRETPRSSPPPALPTSPAGLFFEAERLPRQVGAVIPDPDASWGRAVRADPGRDGREGFLAFGARAGLPRGSYRMLFRLRGQEASAGEVGRIEAVADGGTRILAARVLSGRELSGAYEDQTLALTLPQPEWVEFRVFWAGRGELAVDYVYGFFADVPDPPGTFEPGQFRTESGPYRRLPAGDSLVSFRTTVTTRTPGPAARFRVVTAHERAPLAAQLLHGTDVVAAGTAEEIAVPVRLERARVVEFLIDILAPGVTVDRIVVTPGHRVGGRAVLPRTTG